MNRILILSLAGSVLGAMACMAEEDGAFQATMQKGTLLFKQGHYDEAQAAFEQAVEMNPGTNESARAEVKIGTCLVKQDKVGKGIARIKAVLGTDELPEYVKIEACVALGDAHGFKLKDKETALTFYKQALEYPSIQGRRRAAIQKKIDRFSE